MIVIGPAGIPRMAARKASASSASSASMRRVPGSDAGRRLWTRDAFDRNELRQIGVQVEPTGALRHRQATKG
jgi:hypothetical protein